MPFFVTKSLSLKKLRLLPSLFSETIIPLSCSGDYFTIVTYSSFLRLLKGTQLVKGTLMQI